MQSNAMVINKVIRTKDQGHTCLQPKSSCSEPSSSYSPKLSNHVHSTRINHRAQAYKANKQAQLRTMHQSNQSFKERT
jgi:hypothetical protein